MQSTTIVYSSTTLIFLVILAIWSVPWKGIALWKAARNKSLAWFVVLFIVNTAGILEILYIFVFSKRGKDKSVETGETK